MLRRIPLALVTLLALSPTRPARAQGETFAGVMAIGWLAASGVAIARVTGGANAGVGSRVRFVNDSGGMTDGVIAAMAGDDVTVTLPDAGQRRLSRARVQDVNTGVESKWAQGWVGGLVVGVVGGAVIGFSSGDDPDTQWFAFTAGEKAAMLGVGLGVVGSVVGGIGGALVKGERWKHISDFASRISVGPTTGAGVTMAVTLRF